MKEPNKKYLDKNKCEIVLCKFKDIRHIFEAYHYKKGAMGGGITACFAMLIDGKIIGGSVLGKPRHEKKYKNCIDIRRMACLDSAPTNSESWFLSQIIKYCACNLNFDYVLSYSDKTVGHEGTIYKASNFQLIGETKPTKTVFWGDKQYHPRSLSIDRPYSYKLREAVKNGEAEIKIGLPKKIWIYTISKKLKRKRKNVKNIKEIAQPKLFQTNPKLIQKILLTL